MMTDDAKWQRRAPLKNRLNTDLSGHEHNRVLPVERPLGAEEALRSLEVERFFDLFDIVDRSDRSGPRS